MKAADKITYRLKLQVLTPLFVGGGDNFNLTRVNYAFVPHEKKIYVLDERKWFDYLHQKRLLNEYANYIRLVSGAKSGGADIYQWLRSKEARLKARAEAVLKQASSREYSTAWHPDFRTNNIHGFIKDPSGRPYIPGSTIKGALRTAVMSSLLQKMPSGRAYVRELESVLEGKKADSEGKKKFNRKELEKLGSKIESSLLDFQENINGCPETFKGMAGLSVSDSTPFPPEDLILVKKKDLSLVDGELKGEGGKKGSIPLYRECARPGTEVEFTLTIDFFKINRDYNINSFDDIAGALQKQFQALFGPAGVISFWKKSLGFIPPEALAEDGRGIVVLGGGTGYHSKSVISSLAHDPGEANELTRKILQGIFPAHKHYQDRPLSPRTLKLARLKGQDRLMGICRISEVKEC